MPHRLTHVISAIFLMVLLLAACETFPDDRTDVESGRTDVESGRTAVESNRTAVESNSTTVRAYPDHAPEVRREMRGAWIATVSNMDWPSEPGLPVEEQQQELVDLFDRAAAMNMNAIILQVRPAADALYDSPYEPWSTYLTGEMGRAPEPYYDPLEFAIQEAHKRGLELHAWLNPYRARHPSDQSEPSADHVSNTHPEYMLEYGNYWWMDPGLPEVQDLSHEVIMDVVNRYDIDGLHMDDYYYPYPSTGGFADFPDSLSWQRAQEEGVTMSRDDWRRDNVNRFVERLYNDIKEVKPHVKFGISPIGYWLPGHPVGTFGFDAYDHIYADSRKWLREGWLDNFIPQLYTETSMIARNFPEMLRWWEEQNLEDRHVWAGLIPSSVRRNWSANEILTQVYIARGQQGVSGSVHFRMEDFLVNPQDITELLSSGPYSEPSLIPDAPWLGDVPPGRPDADIEISANQMVIHLTPADGDEVRWWVIRSQTDENFTDNHYTPDNYWELDLVPGLRETVVFSGSEATVWPDEVVISAVDRLGNESETVTVQVNTDRAAARSAGAEMDESPFDLVPRSEWEEEPVGHFANAVRRNLAEGDTLFFRELAVVVNELHGENGPVTGAEERRSAARVTLLKHSVSEVKEIPDGASFNWHGYHIGFPNAEAGDDALLSVEVATVASLAIPRMLSLPRASVLEAGDASFRLWVPHVIRDISLYRAGNHGDLAGYDDPMQSLALLYEWSLEQQNWWDLPYHYLIDRDGTVYEGRDLRFAGDSSTDFDPIGHLLIHAMSEEGQDELTDEQQAAFTELVEWASETYGVSPDRVRDPEGRLTTVQ